MLRCALMVLVVCLAAGCGAPEIVVVDEAGNPIEGAVVKGRAHSTEDRRETKTDVNGEADIPDGIPDTAWISVTKEGHTAELNIGIEQPRPIRVVLRPLPRGGIAVQYKAKSKEVQRFLDGLSDPVPANGPHVSVSVTPNERFRYNRIFDFVIPDAKIAGFVDYVETGEEQPAFEHLEEIPAGRIKEDLRALADHLGKPEAEVKTWIGPFELRPISFRSLRLDMTADDVVELYGEPDRNTGGAFWTGEYDLLDGTVVIVVVDRQRILSVTHVDRKTGKIEDLLTTDADEKDADVYEVYVVHHFKYYRHGDKECQQLLGSWLEVYFPKRRVIAKIVEMNEAMFSVVYDSGKPVGVKKGIEVIPVKDGEDPYGKQRLERHDDYTLYEMPTRIDCLRLTDSTLRAILRKLERR